MLDRSRLDDWSTWAWLACVLAGGLGIAAANGLAVFLEFVPFGALGLFLAIAEARRLVAEDRAAATRAAALEAATSARRRVIADLVRSDRIRGGVS